MASAPSNYTGTCNNMTFVEAQAIILAGEPISIMLCNQSAYVYEYAYSIRYNASTYTEPCIVIKTNNFGTLYWTSTGISTTAPSSGK